MRGWSRATLARYTAAAGALALVTLAGGCISDYNPFTDPDNIDVHFEQQTIATGDTVELFSADTIRVSIQLKEQVDRLLVSASANRTWSGSDTAIEQAYLGEDPFRFVVSFHDTGMQYVALTTLHNGAAHSTDTIAVYVRSPLMADTVRGAFGDTLALVTTAVADTSVRYVWRFGACCEYTTQQCSSAVVVLSAADSTAGELFVTDGRYSSPAVAFHYEMADSTPPLITCLNAEYRGGDTIVVGDSLFNLRLSITDRGLLPVDSASVNGEPFDFIYDTLYLRLLPNLQGNPPTKPYQVDVFALDRYRTGNVARRTFYVAFVDTVTVPVNAALVLSQPSADSITASAPRYTLAGTLQRAGRDTSRVIVDVLLGDSAWSDTAVLDEPQKEWTRAVTLTDSVNTVRILLMDTSRTDTFSAITRTIFFDSLQADTKPPRVVYARIDNLTANRLISVVPVVRLRSYVLDDGVGVDSVFYNDKPVPRDTLANWWVDTVRIAHGTAGTSFKIRARDRYGNDSTVTITMFLDQRPIFEIAPVNRNIGTDTTYRDTMWAVDPDGDPITYSLVTGPKGMTVSGGRISWRPAAGDTGLQTITVQAWDGYQGTRHTYSLNVVNLSTFVPVRFLTDEREFPSYIEVGDTMRLVLRVDSASGVRPYRFGARLVNAGVTLLNQSLTGTLVWAPDTTQLGTQQLVVTVRDNIGFSDTLYARVLVTRANAPCSLGVSFTAPAIAGGAADLNALGTSDALLFRIHDPDPQEVERHTVQLFQARSRTMTTFDSTTVDTFRLVVDPRAYDGWDTVIAIVTDRAGHSDTLAQVLYFGTPPLSPNLIAPTLGAVGVTSPVTLQWQASDPDTDALTYDILIGTNPSSMVAVANTALQSYQLSGLAAGTTYYWQIRARDWKSSTASAVLYFTTQ